MRYYKIIVSDPADGSVLVPGLSAGFSRIPAGKNASTWTSWDDAANKNIPGALNVELDIPVAPEAIPQGNAYVAVWGVSLPQIGQASDLNGMNVEVIAGMKPGLPLAKPQQAGTIVKGQVFQAFGNWEGTNQTIDLIVIAGGTEKRQFVFSWTAGQSLKSAIDATLRQALPNFKRDIQIRDFALSNDEQGVYTSLANFAAFLKDITTGLGIKRFGQSYPGVNIAMRQDTVFVYDDSVPSNIKLTLAFEDFVGQPTWMGPLTISFKTVLRADLGIGDIIKFPPGIVLPYALTTAQAAAPGVPARSKTAFQGTFKIIEVHHFGNFRQPPANSWATAFSAVYQPSQ